MNLFEICDWAYENGYAAALIGADDRIIQGHCDPSDWPRISRSDEWSQDDIVKGKKGTNYWTHPDGFHIVLHSGRLEDSEGKTIAEATGEWRGPDGY